MKKLITNYKARHHQLKKLDIAQALVVILLIGTVGAYKLSTSHAAAVNYPSSGYVKDQNGRPAAGVKIYGCGNNQNTITDANGHFVLNYSQFVEYCVRVVGYPANTSNAVPTNRPWGATPDYPNTYEYQVSGAACHANTTYCGAGKIGGDNHVLYYDMAPENAFNFRVTYVDRVAPSAPSLQASVASTSQINLSWSASTDNYSGIAGYDIFRSNGVKLGSTANRSYPVTGLSSGTAYAFYVRARDNANPQNISVTSNTASATTNRTPNSGGGGSNGGGGSSGGSFPTGGGSTSHPKTATPDKSPPTSPTSLKATANNDHKSVQLDWVASSDNVGVTGYVVDQSADNKNWNNIADNITDTTYEDFNPSFGQINYYRIQAFDAAGNKSKYVYVNVTASNFDANVSKDQQSVVTSDDGVVDISFPSSSLDQNLFCSLTIPKDTLGAAIDKYRQVQGPYQLSCRDSDGTEVDVLSNTTVQTTVHTDKINNGKKISLAYFGQDDGGSWLPLPKAKTDKKAKTDTIDLQGHKNFVIMSPIKKGSVLLPIIEVLMVLLAIGFGVIMFLRFKVRKKLEDKYEEYTRQSRGF